VPSSSSTPPGRAPNALDPAKANEWVVVDFETASTRGTPCQVAAIRYRDGVEADAYTSFVFQPADRFDDFNISLHGITPKMVVGAPAWPAAREELLAYAGGSPFVAHYAPFDMGVVRDACDLCALEWPAIRYACTVSVARMVWPGLSSYSLLLLCAQIGITVDRGRHHEALYDARLAAEVLSQAITAKNAAGLPDLLERISLLFGEIEPGNWFGSHLRALTAGQAPRANPNADHDSPFYEKHVAFTGELAMVRRNAWQLVADAGGEAQDNVTKKTNMLICGYQDMLRLAAGETKSHKLRYAEALHAEGQAIEILTERDFFRMLGGMEPTAAI
jgi:DNA polymerase III epsilon subunit-like protein